MLTLAQIIEVYQGGVKVIFKKSHPFRQKGEYDPFSLEVIVWEENAESKKDFGITLLHEFIHARDDVRGKYFEKDKRYEDRVEAEAVLTYEKKPELVDYIKRLYRKKPKSKRLISYKKNSRDI